MTALEIPIPAQAEAVLARLTDAGYEAYIVGGCVRDAMRGAIPNDWDCTTSAHPEQIAACFPDRHVIETGMQHGTVTVVIDKMPIEITTFRIDGSYADHRRPDSVTFTSSLTEDLARRDFTVNAMAYHPQTGLADPFGGAEDLAAHRLRCVGRPDDRFEEDGLRILRAMRFSSVLDFAIDRDTADAVHRKKALLQHISAERIYAELKKLLCGKGAERILKEYADVLFLILPALAPMAAFDQQSRHHDFDVYTHTIKTVAACPPDKTLRLAALLHDSGKPHCFTLDDRGGHFYGHAEVSAEITARIMHALKSDRKTAERVLLLVKLHDTVWNGTEKQVRRIVSKIGFEAAEQLLHLHCADVAAQKTDGNPARIAEAQLLFAMLSQLKAANACLSVRQLAVGGSDLLALGIPQGKAIGQCLHYLLNLVLEQQCPNTQETLLDAAQAWCKGNI